MLELIDLLEIKVCKYSYREHKQNPRVVKVDSYIKYVFEFQFEFMVEKLKKLTLSQLLVLFYKIIKYNVTGVTVEMSDRALSMKTLKTL